MRSIAIVLGAGIMALALVEACQGGPLASDTNAHLKGTKVFSKIISGTPFTTNVDYAVYAPGQFLSSVALDTPPDPSGGSDPSFLTDWVYAYEVFPQTHLVKDLTVFTTVHAVPNGYEGTNHIGNYSFAPELGAIPNTWQFNTASNPQRIANAKWTNTAGIPIGGHSDIYYFTSPYSPKFATASVFGGGPLLVSSTLPSPVPEPTTATLSAIGFAVIGLFVARRRLRRRTA
jgi:hypothetical protein